MTTGTQEPMLGLGAGEAPFGDTSSMAFEGQGAELALTEGFGGLEAGRPEAFTEAQLDALFAEELSPEVELDLAVMDESRLAEEELQAAIDEREEINLDNLLAVLKNRPGLKITFSY